MGGHQSTTTTTATATTMLRHWSQLVPNMSADIRGQQHYLPTYLLSFFVQSSGAAGVKVEVAVLGSRP